MCWLLHSVVRCEETRDLLMVFYCSEEAKSLGGCFFYCYHLQIHMFFNLLVFCCSLWGDKRLVVGKNNKITSLPHKKQPIPGIPWNLYLGHERLNTILFTDILPESFLSWHKALHRKNYNKKKIKLWFAKHTIFIGNTNSLPHKSIKSENFTNIPYFTYKSYKFFKVAINT